MKKVFLSIAIAGLYTASIAQVKIGVNPTQIVSGAKLQVDGDNTTATPSKLIITSSGNVGIGTSAPTNVLHVKSVANPLRLEGLQSAANGIDSVLVVDPITGILKYEKLGTAAKADTADFWALKGNYNTNPRTKVGISVLTTDFLGTADAKNLVFATNDTTRMLLDTHGSIYGGNSTYDVTLSTKSALVWGNSNKDSAIYSLVTGNGNAIGSSGASSIIGGTGNIVTGSGNNNCMVTGLSNTLNDNSSESIVSGFLNSLTNSSSSIVAGHRNILSNADYSLVNGFLDTVYSSNNIVGGFSNNLGASSGSSAVFGYSNVVNSANVVVAGDSNQLNSSSNNSAAFGYQNSLNNAPYSLVSGFRNVDSAQWTLATGSGNIVNGNYSVVGGLQNATRAIETATFGGNNTINAGAAFGMAFGQGNTISANHNNSMAIGKGVTTSASAQMVTGFAGGYNFYTNAANTVGVALASSGTSFTSISDKRSKNSIENIGYGLATVMALRPTQYRYNGNNKTSLGFIAQEVKEVVPEVVELTTMGPNHDYLGINYTEMIPVLTKAIQELKGESEVVKAENQSIKMKNAALESEIASLKTSIQDIAVLAKQVQQLQALFIGGKTNVTAKK